MPTTAAEPTVEADAETDAVSTRARALESEGRLVEAAELMCRHYQRRQYREQPIATQFLSAWVALTERARQAPMQSATQFALMAKSLSNQGRCAEALEAGAQALALDALNPIALRLRAVDLLSLGRIAEAVRAARQSQWLTPDDAMTQFIGGAVSLHTGNPSQALEAFDHALALAPRLQALGDADPLGYQLDIVHQRRGKALLALDRGQEALAAFSAALAIDPTNPGHHRLRLATLQRLAGSAAATAAAAAGQARRLSLASDQLKAEVRVAQEALDALAPSNGLLNAPVPP